MQDTVQLVVRHQRWRRLARLLVLALALFPAAAAADVSYFIYGRAFSVHTPQGTVVATTTSAIPGVVATAPEPAGPPAAPVPFPGVTVEAYRADTNVLLGRGRGTREGYYNLTYNAPEANHAVRFLVFLDFADGTRELAGTVDKLSDGSPIVVNNRLFSFNLMVPTASALHAGTTSFSPSGEFLFIEVGDVDMSDIYDQQQDAAAGAALWGLTKPSQFGFGSGLELYGLVGAASPARYYRIHYSGPATGDVHDPLDKKNYVLAGTGIEIYPTRLGPKDVVTAAGTLTGVYELDERMAGQVIPGSPGRVYSTFWTESGLRAVWNSASVPEGSYVLSFEAFAADGTPVAASGNNFATLNLQVVNTPPVAQIHDIEYLDNTVVLNDAAPCQTVVLNHITASTLDDTLQFRITANHPTPRYFGSYVLSASFGHDLAAWTVGPVTTPVTNSPVATPVAYAYQSCAYRFHLRVMPKITDGYNVIYIRDDNWYAALDVIP